MTDIFKTLQDNIIKLAESQETDFLPLVKSVYGDTPDAVLKGALFASYIYKEGNKKQKKILLECDSELKEKGSRKHIKQFNQMFPDVIESIHKKKSSKPKPVTINIHPMQPIPKQFKGMIDLKKNIIDRIVKHYLESHDFNGIGVEKFSSDGEHSAIKKLIVERKVDLIWYANFHIKNFKAKPIKTQSAVEEIESNGFSGCLYPTPEILKELNAGAKEKSPYTQELMKGVPQLSFRFFDLRMLEWYRNDPRFDCKGDDINYRIVQKADTQITGGKLIKDDFEFFRLGFAYNSKKERAIVALICDLNKLPHEQQIDMKRHELGGDYQPHPGFYETKILGEFQSGMSMYDAFLSEKTQINRICKIIGKPSLFKTSHSIDDKRPDGFGILMRPTKKEFGDFALLLDQLLNDDISYDFFKKAKGIDIHNHLTDMDGNSVKQTKGKIQLLEEWVKPRFILKNPEDLKKFFKNFRDVRMARNTPAHNAENNEFNQKYITDQRELISKAYNAVLCLRIILQKHPNASEYKTPKYLDEAKIWLM